MRMLYCSLVIGFIVLLAIFADLISSLADLNPNQQNILARYLPPLSHSEISADTKQTLLEKWITTNPTQAKTLAKILVDQGASSSPEDEIVFDVGTRSQKEALEILQKIDSSETANFQNLLASFSSLHLLGTDEIGRDVFIRLVYGARISMGVGVMVALTSAILGLILGSLAGYYGGFIDTLLMRVTDSLLSLPMMPILIIVSAIDLQKLPAVKFFLSQGNESIVKMFLILCLFSWMPVARLARGNILSLKNMDFVMAARTLGAKDHTIILRHLFPNMMAPILVAVTLGVGESILYEAALSFLGLGIMPPTSSWGNMLTNAQEVIFKSPWLTILPGLMIFITTVSINLIGDGLQSVLNPKIQRH
jgi:peptide/nickel transport system permease protein